MKIKGKAIWFAVIFLLVVGQYLFLPEWYREPSISVSGWLIMISIATAIGLSIWLINFIITKLNSTASRCSRIGTHIGGYGIYPFALFVGLIVGGNFGGAIGDSVLGDIGIIVGLGLGIFIVIIMVCSAGALCGFLLGGFVERIIR